MASYKIWAHLIFALCLFPGSTTAEQGQTIRLLTWNIQALTGHYHESLIPQIPAARTTTDFERIRYYIEKADADLLALQEIADPLALDRLSLPLEYDIRVADTMLSDNRAARDIFTSVGVKPDLFDGLRFETIRNMSFKENSSATDPFPFSRAAVAAVGSLGQLRIALVSVHLESGCSVFGPESVFGSTSESCKIFVRQITALREWISARESEVDIFMIAGDFNVPLQYYPVFVGEESPVLSFLGSGLPKYFRYLAPEKIRPNYLCRSGQRPLFIDYLVVLSNIEITDIHVQEMNFEEDDRDHGVILSDHCPIFFEVSF